MKLIQPSTEEDEKYYAELPIGSRFWVPCPGIESLGIQRGHVGRVDIYLGDKKFGMGGWISIDKAEEEKITLANKEELCENCKKMRDEITNSKVQG